MWDASGKVADGIGVGGTETRGHPDLCEEVSAHFPGTLLSHLEPHEHLLALHNITLTTFSHEALQQRDTSLRGRYCLVSVRWVTSLPHITLVFYLVLTFHANIFNYYAQLFFSPSRERIFN